MVRYRRNFVAGGTFFFTVTLLDRKSRMLTDHIEASRTAVTRTRHTQASSIDAVVVLPDHLHMIMTLPEGDADYPNRWRLIKRRFTDAVSKSGTPVARRQNGELHPMAASVLGAHSRDEKDFERHVDDIHFNPVKHALVSRLCDWPYSSFHRYVRQGVLPEDWGGDVSGIPGGFGERHP